MNRPCGRRADEYEEHGTIATYVAVRLVRGDADAVASPSTRSDDVLVVYAHDELVGGEVREVLRERLVHVNILQSGVKTMLT